MTPQLDDFLYPRSRFYGRCSPGAQQFNADLQDFGQRVSMICALSTGGKLSSKEAYQQVSRLWSQFEYPRYTCDEAC